MKAIGLQYLVIALLPVTILSCVQTKHEGFESDCVVYTYEVKSEPIAHGHVEYIDTSTASGCAKDELKNVFLLYYDTVCVTVYNQHPIRNFGLIERFIKQYQTDTTRLSAFVKYDSSVRITVSRFCKDRADKDHNNKYVDWRDIEFTTLTNRPVEINDFVINTWHKWNQ